MAPTEAQRRAKAAYAERLKSGGWRKVTFMADANMAAKIDRLTLEHGTLQAAMAHLLADQSSVSA